MSLEVDVRAGMNPINGYHQAFIYREHADQICCRELMETRVKPYPGEVESQMKAFFDSLSEKDRRRYAAVEAVKLGHGGIEYLANVLGCDEKTIRRGKADIDQLPRDPSEGRIRKKRANQSLGTSDSPNCSSDSGNRQPTIEH
jgi:hypothetical protein